MNIDYNNFKQWCILKEPKLGHYVNNDRISYSILFIWIGSFILSALVFKNVIIELLQNEKIVENLSTLFGFIFSMFVVIIFSKVFRLPMNKTEFLSCLLNKISKEIELYQSEKDRKELMKDLKIFKRYSKFDYKFTHTNLFKKENKIQKSFFNLLNSLSDRIYYKINENKKDEINLEDIQKLAFSIYIDGDEKTQILNKIVKDIPDINEIEFKLFFPLKKLYKDNLFKIITITVSLALIFYFFAYRFLGIDKNYTFMGFITLIGVVAYIIFKK